jgi:hypothetical protein
MARHNFSEGRWARTHFWSETWSAKNVAFCRYVTHSDDKGGEMARLCNKENVNSVICALENLDEKALSGHPWHDHVD